MTRNIKALGLAFVAAAVMSMAVAASVQAAQVHITTPNQVAVITGNKDLQTGKFQVTPPTGPSVACAQATFEATVTDQGLDPSQLTSQEFTMTPTYAGCTAFGQAASVKMNGCKYTVTGTGQPANTAVVDIVACTSGKQIEVQTAICQIKIGEQTTGGHVTFTNIPEAGNTAHYVTAHAAVTGIKYQVSGAVCGHAVNVNTTDGSYEETINFEAFTHTNPEQVTEHSHQFSKVKDINPQLGMLST